MSRPLKLNIRDLPLGVFKSPVSRWFLSLRRADGTRDVRKVTGTYQEARTRRNECMATGNYVMAWLNEER